MFFFISFTTVMHVIVPLIFPCSVQILLENASISAYYILRSLVVEEFFLVTKGFSFFLFLLGFFGILFSFFVSFFFSFFSLASSPFVRTTGPSQNLAFAKLCDTRS